MIGSLMSDEPEAHLRIRIEVLFWNLPEVTKKSRSGQEIFMAYMVEMKGFHGW